MENRYKVHKVLFENSVIEEMKQENVIQIILRVILFILLALLAVFMFGLSVTIYK